MSILMAFRPQQTSGIGFSFASNSNLYLTHTLLEGKARAAVVIGFIPVPYIFFSIALIVFGVAVLISGLSLFFKVIVRRFKKKV